MSIPLCPGGISKKDANSQGIHSLQNNKIPKEVVGGEGWDGCKSPRVKLIQRRNLLLPESKKRSRLALFSLELCLSRNSSSLMTSGMFFWLFSSLMVSSLARGRIERESGMTGGIDSDVQQGRKVLPFAVLVPFPYPLKNYRYGTCNLVSTKPHLALFMVS
ncbi:hypothetical protein CEXT_553651 [Caerostris extrusa]|uniref:Uncharacterized protein n=1 Tax=Caerostris extrusa TaxID=172846 RepID=A0AAV4Q107_CAEEX|nr:hypothetical protein CEXT_553651 [Caerostris extrusa]